MTAFTEEEAKGLILEAIELNDEIGQQYQPAEILAGDLPLPTNYSWELLSMSTRYFQEDARPTAPFTLLFHTNGPGLLRFECKYEAGADGAVTTTVWRLSAILVQAPTERSESSGSASPSGSDNSE